ncbi:UNVERIFIED_CONTAM: hypothetical protein GTU68_029521 [Idotea baltica]|nr:hypothetical protein [Idotea baltica]
MTASEAPLAFDYYRSGSSYGPEPGQAYSNPFGNVTVVDNVFEEMLPYVNHHWYSFPPMNPLWYGLVSFFVGFCTIFALVGNISVIYIFSCTKSLRSPSNYFVVNLAISDFLLMAIMGPPVLYNSYYRTWALGALFCQIYGVIGSLMGCTSIFTMCLITGDRYNVIVKGIAGKPLTPTSAMIRILLVWLVSGAWTIAPLLGWGRYTPEGNMTACGTDYLMRDWNTMSYVLAYGTWVYFVPLVYIVYSYWYIVAAVTAHEKQMKEQAKKMGVKSLRNDKDAQKKSAECKLAKVALVTVSLWFMAWTPYLIINFAGIYKRGVVTPLFSIWGSVFAKANTVYNPIVYAISHPKYKAALEKKFPCLSCQPEKDDDESKSTASVMTTNEEAKD